MSELLPCPFCGGEAARGGNFIGVVVVYCTACEAQGAKGTADWRESGNVQTEQKEQSAIAAWNHRVEGKG